MSNGAPPSRQSTLRFRLPGEWDRLDLSSQEAVDRSVSEIAIRRVGAGDELAGARGLVRRQLSSAGTAALRAGALETLLAHQITAGTPLPVSLSIFEPRFDMSPAIGNDARNVLAVLERGLRASTAESAREVHRRPFSQGETLRTEAPPTSETDGAEHLSVDYWYPVPDSKSVVLVSMATPLVEIRHTMLSFFDAIVASSYFE